MMIKLIIRAPDKVYIFIPIMPISLPNPMFDHLLELFHRYDSNKWSNIGFGQEITQVESTEVNFIHLIWGSVIQLFITIHIFHLLYSGSIDPEL